MSWSYATLNYIAGLYEGEGCISIPTKNSPLRLRIKMTDVDVLKRFQSLAECGYVGGPYKPSGLGKKHVYEFAVNGTKAYALAAAIYGLVGSRRRAQIIRALAAYANISHWRILRPEIVADIRTRLAAGRHGIGRKLSREYGVTDAMISAIKYNRAWR